MSDRFAHRVGARIKQLRQEKGMSQRDLANDQMSPGFLSQVERGLTSPSLTSLCIIAKNLNVPTASLLPEEGADESQLQQQVEILLTAAEAQLGVGNLDEAKEGLQHIRELLGEGSLDDPIMTARVLLQSGLIEMHRDNHEAAFNNLTEATERFESASDPGGVLQCLLALGEMHLTGDNALLAIRFFETVSRRLNEVQGAARERYRFLLRWGLARAYQQLGETETADELLEQVMEDMPSQTRPRSLVIASLREAMQHLEQGDQQRAAGCAAAARELALFRQMRRTESEAMYTRGMVAEEEGRRSEALDALRAAQRTAQDVGAQTTRARALLAEGRIRLRQDDLPRAADAAEKAMSITSSRFQPLLHGRAALLAGKIAAARDNLDEAEDFLSRAERCFRSANEVPLLAHTQTELGEVYLATGRRDEALRRFQRASDLFSKASKQPDA